MLFAQSVVEYGAASSLSTTIQSLTYSVGTWLEGISATTWVVVAIVVVGLVVFVRR